MTPGASASNLGVPQSRSPAPVVWKYGTRANPNLNAIKNETLTRAFPAGRLTGMEPSRGDNIIRVLFAVVQLAIGLEQPNPSVHPLPNRFLLNTAEAGAFRSPGGRVGCIHLLPTWLALTQISSVKGGGLFSLPCACPRSFRNKRLRCRWGNSAFCKSSPKSAPCSPQPHPLNGHPSRTRQAAGLSSPHAA